MTEKLKKLTVNTGICDMTKLREETLAAYGHITINAAAILLSPKAKELLAGAPVTMNAATITDVPEGLQMSVKNGMFEIAGGEAPTVPTMLTVNGKLIIRPGSQEALKGYASIQINGMVIYPRSLEGIMAGVQVNGKAMSYPDEAILIDGKLRVDELFILRAKDAAYFVTGSVAMTDETLDIQALVQKGTRFITRKAYIAQKLLADALPLFDDEARITAIPGGFAFIEGAETLDEGLVLQHGTRLFFPDDLFIEEKQEGTLKKLEGLIVTGSVTLPERLAETFLAAKPRYSTLHTYKGTLLRDRGSLTISLAMLHQHPEGLTLVDCGSVTLEADIPAQDILDKLTLIDCGAVLCHQGQQGALEQVASGVGDITTADHDEEEAEKEDDLHETVNTAYYTF